MSEKSENVLENVEAQLTIKKGDILKVNEHALSLIKKAENKVGALMVVVGTILMASIILSASFVPEYLTDVSVIGGFLFCFNFGALAGIILIEWILKEPSK